MSIENVEKTNLVRFDHPAHEFGLLGKFGSKKESIQFFVKKVQALTFWYQTNNFCILGNSSIYFDV